MDLCGSGSKLVITHLAFSELIVGDGHVVLITCSITVKVNKGLQGRPVSPPVAEGWMALTKVRKKKNHSVLSPFL